MSSAPPQRGGEAIGQLTALDPLRMVAVLYFRLWCDGAAGQTAVSRDLQAYLGNDAHIAVSALQNILDLCGKHGRRKLVRHKSGCSCLGADEAWFATLVETAASGADEDACQIASFFVSPTCARALTGAAAMFGMALIHVAQTGAAPVPDVTTPQAKPPTHSADHHPSRLH